MGLLYTFMKVRDSSTAECRGNPGPVEEIFIALNLHRSKSEDLEKNSII